jgi:class 3 adenylate cyclase/predicted ATPase
LSPASTREDHDERRQLTLVFSDLAGSTGLSRALDPEDMRDLLKAYQSTCAEIAERWGGYVAQYLGDGILIYFGYPTAHENDAQRAVSAAFEMTQKVPLIRTPQSSRPLEVRVGVDTGRTVLTAVGTGHRREKLAVGKAPNVAARIQAMAPLNAVVVSDSTMRLINGFFECEKLKEIGGEYGMGTLHRVIRPTGALRAIDAAARIGLTQFVGRSFELAALQGLWARVVEGTSGSVLIEGSPGIGKSRLVKELKEHVAQSGARVVEWNCTWDGRGTALRPVAEALARAVDSKDGDTADESLQKLERGFPELSSPNQEAVWLLGSLLSGKLDRRLGDTTAQSVRKKTLETIVRLLQKISAEQQLLLVVEDLHWADPSTLELIGMVLEGLRKEPFLLVLTARPEFRFPLPAVGGLRLAPLPAADVERMIRDVARDAELPADILETIVSRSDGLPLFVEELTRVVVESGALSPLEIPLKLEESITARLDRASMPVAQRGSVIGMSFGFEMIRSLVDTTEAELLTNLQELVKADLLTVTGEGPNAQWKFKHAMIQHAAYSSLSLKVRPQLHRRIADALAARFPKVVETEPEVLANHLEQAGDVDAATQHFKRAGYLALSRAATREAINHFRHALELVPKLPDQARAETELALQRGLAPAEMAIKGWASPEAEAACERARDLCNELGDRNRLQQALWGIWAARFLRGNLDSTLEAAQKVLEFGEMSALPKDKVFGHHAMGFTCYFRGELLEAQHHAERGILLYDLDQEREIVSEQQLSSTVAMRAFSAASLWLLGRRADAEREILAAEELTRQLKNPPNTAFFLSFAAYLPFYDGDHKKVLSVTEEMLRLSEHEGYLLWIGVAKVYRGWARAGLGAVAAGLDEVRNGVELFRKTGSELTTVQMSLALAQTLRRAGKADEALTVLDAAQTYAKSHAEHLLESELYRVRAEILLEKPSVDEASVDTALTRALEIAKAQGARPLERRAEETRALLGNLER